jgi:hypothetical protein
MVHLYSGGFKMKNSILFLLVLLSTFAIAKDHDYQTGILHKRAVSTGWSDSTRCSGTPGYVSCSGGISEDQEIVVFITMSDGVTVELHPLAFHHVAGWKNGSSWADGSAIRYRLEHRMGMGKTYLMIIPDPDTNKESRFTFESK